VVNLLEAQTLWELVEGRAGATPDKEMTVDEDGRRITFGGYKAAAERAAAGLAAGGIGAGQVVSWMLPTWHESLILAAALSRLSAVQNPIIPIYREREVGFIAAQAGVDVLIVPSRWRSFDYQAMAASVARANGGRPEVLVCDRTLPEGDPAALPAPPAPARGGDAPVRWLFYTSGTTADPKGAQHSDASILAAARGMTECLDFGPDDRGALAFPFTHIAGPIWLCSSLLTGGANIIIEMFDPVRTVEVLGREGVTMAGSGTLFHQAYLAAQRKTPGAPIFPHLRNCPGGGAPKPPQLHYEVKNELGGVGIVSGWGLTEAPILTMARPDDPDEKLAGTEGRPMPGVQLRVVTLEGVAAGPGQEGELRARAPQLMQGYLDKALDADAFDEEGYFRTGDLGVVDAQGYVTITGRLKDVIIRKGENISAKEVEDLLYLHPKVADVAVVGLPDPSTGERCCAVVAMKEGEEPLGFAEMQEFLRGKGLRVQAVPERLELVDTVPRNASGKILKHKLKEHYAGG
jgi:acyl-CoA synthetase (AMP-forming)/AMP-acid ligase II